MTFRLKVCGITEAGGLEAAVEAGADAVGFNFHPASPRFVSPDRVRDLVRRLPDGVAAVGVFVNRELGEVREWMQRSAVTWAQFHGDEPPALLNRFPLPWYPAVRTVPGAATDPSLWQAPWLLLDAHVPGEYGGTGRLADWETAATLARRHPVILAGGLGEDNLAAALAAVGPAGVDLNSGVESAPGVKDPARLARAAAILAEWRARCAVERP